MIGGGGAFFLAAAFTVDEAFLAGLWRVVRAVDTEAAALADGSRLRDEREVDTAGTATFE